MLNITQSDAVLHLEVHKLKWELYYYFLIQVGSIQV